MSKRTQWYVFAGGGTGGHLYPALSVVDSLRALAGEAVEVSFLCTDRPIDGQVLGAAGVEALPQQVRPMSSRPWHWPGFLLKWQASVRYCRDLFTARRPAAVIGAGGYASGPPVRAAVRMGIPTFLLNPDAMPGRANQYLARKGYAQGIFAQWAESQEHLPAGAPVLVTGCPVRPAFRTVQRQNRDDILRSFGLDPARRTLLVTGASQGARTINEAMIRLARTMDFAGWQILHLTGAADEARVKAAYSGGKSSLGMWRFHGQVLAFTERMPEAMWAADLILSRAGASTLAEITAVGKASILMPYPFHRDQHQVHNALVLVDAGAASMVTDAQSAEPNAARLGPVLAELMRNDKRREDMAAAARTLDRPDAAGVIARRLLEAADQSHSRTERRAGRPAAPMLSRATA